MSTTTAPLIFNPQVLAQAVAAGFANLPIFYGSGAVVTDTAMPYGNEYMGLQINIPYFSTPQQWQVLSDGTAASTVQIGIGNAAGNSTTPEQETVLRAVTALQFTTWAKSNPLDPYGEGRRQMLLGFAQAMENQLITKATDSTGWSSYTIDISGNTDPLLSHDAVVDGIGALGGEGYNDPFVFGVVHSHTIGTMFKRKDALGRPWLVGRTGEMTSDGVQIYRMEPLGIPIMVSDLLPVSNGVYTSVFCRRNSLALWINPNLSARSVQSPLDDSQIDALNAYFVAHRYKRIKNRSKPGVVMITSA